MIGKRVLGILGVLSAIAALGVASSASAQPVVGVPHEWQMDFPAPYTPLMVKVEQSLHDLLLVIITLISVFVLALLLYAMWRFHASRNPTATATTHNTFLEIAWTVIPILILVVDRDPVVPAALLRRQGGGRRHDDQGHRPPVVLVVCLSRPGQLHGREPHSERGRSRQAEAEPAPPAGGG